MGWRFELCGLLQPVHQPTHKLIEDWWNGWMACLRVLTTASERHPNSTFLRLIANLHQTDVAKPLHYGQHF